MLSAKAPESTVLRAIVLRSFYVPFCASTCAVSVRFYACVERSDRDVIPCQRCAGSGEGPVDGTVCLACHGRGEIDVGDHDADEARREDAYDAWREQLRDERECAGVSA